MQILRIPGISSPILLISEKEELSASARYEDQFGIGESLAFSHKTEILDSIAHEYRKYDSLESAECFLESILNYVRNLSAHH